ncbi:hypothetical protein DFH09DRAFT_1227305 [Mycena vulgaris]|nr:hypothetical protein DFH09DRAFT_1227305 [Mycena vulgaris]
MKRDDIEAKIRRLKEHVNKCYLQFTAFSAARIEQTTTRIEETAQNTTLRLEQTLIVNHVENQVKFERLEGMMARVLLETQFGQDVMNRTMEIIASDTAHQTIEFQYLSAQALRLVDSIQRLQLAASTNTLAFTEPVSATHVLYNVLTLTLQIDESPPEIVFASLQTIIHIGDFLSMLRMNSEAIAWYRMTIQILRRWVLTNLALSSLNLSCRYQYEFRQQAMDSCRLWQELSPDLDYRPLLSAILIETGQLEDAISNAEEAVAQLIDSADEWKAVKFHQALFALAAAHASADQHLAAYETLLRFPTGHLPSGTDIDISIDQMCKVAEGEITLLFRDLARIHAETFAFHFLRILHAYAYLRQHNSPDFSNLRLFLEPDSGSPLPLDAFNNLQLYINDFEPYGGIIEDVIRAYYPWDTQSDVAPLIKNIFGVHFHRATSAVHQVISKLMTDPDSDPNILKWVLADVAWDILPLVTRAQQLVLMEIMTKVVGHLRTLRTTPSSQTDRVLGDFSYGLWTAGLLNEAMPIIDEALEHRRCGLAGDNDHTEDLDGLRKWIVDRTFVLCDMCRIPEAIAAAQEARPIFTLAKAKTDMYGLCYHAIRIRLVQRTGRDREAIQLLRNVVSEVGLFWTEDDMDIRCYTQILLADLAEIRRRTGQFRNALVDAERAVAAGRKDVAMKHADMSSVEQALVHALSTLSNCLAAVGRNNEALAVSEEAKSRYKLNASCMWGDHVYALRRGELGANAFGALSLRLATSGQLEAALLNAEKAIELYRESVSLTPRLLPTLASSLQNLASILWNVGRRDESVSIMRKVADNETYFLGALGEALDQLARYLAEKGDTERATVVTSESGEVRNKVALLPPEPEFLFSDVEMDDSEDECEDDDWETATESDDDYQDAATDIKLEASELEGAGANLALIQPEAEAAREVGAEVNT